MGGTISILLLLFLCWCGGSTYYYVCNIKGLCPDSESEVMVTPEVAPPVVPAGDMVTQLSDEQIYFNEQSRYRLVELANGQPDTLVITMYQFESEPLSFVETRQVQMDSFLRASGWATPVRYQVEQIGAMPQGLTAAVALNVIEAQAIDVAAEPEPVKKEASFEIKTGTSGTITILFPVASADPKQSGEVEAALREVAEKLKNSNQRLEVAGHTDNSGKPEVNEYYGQLRADAIASILTGYGVPKNQLTIISKGETEPVASNDTAAGRRENRRVSLTYLP